MYMFALHRVNPLKPGCNVSSLFRQCYSYECTILMSALMGSIVYNLIGYLIK